MGEKLSVADACLSEDWGPLIPGQENAMPLPRILLDPAGGLYFDAQLEEWRFQRRRASGLQGDLTRKSAPRSTLEKS